MKAKISNRDSLNTLLNTSASAIDQFQGRDKFFWMFVFPFMPTFLAQFDILDFIEPGGGASLITPSMNFSQTL
jgi:hypothetical protein